MLSRTEEGPELEVTVSLRGVPGVLTRWLNDSSLYPFAVVVYFDKRLGIYHPSRYHICRNHRQTPKVTRKCNLAL